MSRDALFFETSTTNLVESACFCFLCFKIESQKYNICKSLCVSRRFLFQKDQGISISVRFLMGVGTSSLSFGSESWLLNSPNKVG